MNRAEAIKYLEQHKYSNTCGQKSLEESNEAIDMAIEALSESNVHNLHSGDLIGRENAIALLTKIVFDEPPHLDSETLCRLYAEEQINTLPSAEAVQGCDGCKYDTRIPQKRCLRCKRYWRDSYERKGGDTE